MSKLNRHARSSSFRERICPVVSSLTLYGLFLLSKVKKGNVIWYSTVADPGGGGHYNNHCVNTREEHGAMGKSRGFVNVAA